MGVTNKTVFEISPKVIAICKLTLSNFRSYEAANIETGGMSVVVTGPNGAGKTNILEALSFLGPGRGLKNAKLWEVSRQVRHQQQNKKTLPWAINAKLKTPGGILEIGTGLSAKDIAEGRERRTVRIGGSEQSNQTALSKQIAIVWLTPNMNGLLAAGMTQRRQFIDRLVSASDPAHTGRVREYEKAMRERLHLLTKQHSSTDIDWLSILEQRMAEKGCAIAVARLDLMESLSGRCMQGHDPFPSISIEMTGQIENWVSQSSALQVEDRIKEELESSRANDAYTKKTKIGPHTSKLQVTYAEKNQLAEFCSTGEQKAMLISLVLSHCQLQLAECGKPVLLLLDEIAAHLDKKKRSALFNILDQSGCQAWLTGTDPFLFKEIKGQARFFQVGDGKIMEAN